VINSCDLRVSNRRGYIAYNEMGKQNKGAVVANCKIPSQHLLEKLR